MNIILEKLEFWSFKGQTHAVYEFPLKANIYGANAAGKSTIKTGVNWILFDKDDQLNGNMNPFPNDGHECTPTVEATFNIDGVRYAYAKTQKNSVAEYKTGTKVSTKNSYSLNGVPMTLRDLTKRFEELGIDLNRAEMLMNVGVFMTQKTATMRQTLFDMVSEVSDSEIAKETGLEDLSKLLENYSLLEVEMMKKAEKKKAEERLKTIPDLILGMETAKVEPSTDLVQRITGLQTEIAGLTAYEGESGVASSAQLSAEIQTCLLKQKNILDEANAAHLHKVAEAKRKIAEARAILTESESVQRDIQSRINLYTHRLQSMLEQERVLLDSYKARKAESFPESKTVCPTCGQSLPADQISEMKAKWETAHIATLEEDAKNGNELHRKIIALKKDIDGETEHVQAQIEKVRSVREQVDEAQRSLEVLNGIPLSNGSDIPEFTALQEQIDELKGRLEVVREIEETRAEKKEELRQKTAELEDLKGKLAKIEVNKDIDKKIEDLEDERDRQADVRDSAMMILDQISRLNTMKNVKLSEMINRHFSLVRFELFEVLKNGETRDCCKPYVYDDESGQYRSMTDGSANYSLYLRGLIDISNSLQKFYGTYYPLIIDGAEAIDAENKKLIKTDCQLIFLSVKDGSPLTIEEIRE